MKTIEERLQILEDEAEIRSIVARFADACVLEDYEAVKLLWAHDGVWSIHEPFNINAKGIEKIDELGKELRSGKIFFGQFVHSGVIKLDGDKAKARWIMGETAQGQAEGQYYNNYAIYQDTMEKIDGKWFFKTRDYHYLWLDTEAFNGKGFTLPQLDNVL